MTRSDRIALGSLIFAALSVLASIILYSLSDTKQTSTTLGTLEERVRTLGVVVDSFDNRLTKASSIAQESNNMALASSTTLGGLKGTISALTERVRHTEQELVRIRRDISRAAGAIGTITAWTYEDAPEKWRICNGTSIDYRGHEELYSLLRGKYGNDTREKPKDGKVKLPDYRGYFLRGHGRVDDKHRSGSLGTPQPDTVGPHQHRHRDAHAAAPHQHRRALDNQSEVARKTPSRMQPAVPLLVAAHLSVGCVLSLGSSWGGAAV